MGYLSERVSYLRGLVDGIKLDENSPESRIFGEIIELLDDMASSIENIDEKQNDISEELADTQEDLYDFLYDDEDADEDEDDFIEEFRCPNCGEILPVDEELLESDEEITLDCPGCGEKVTISTEDACDDYDDCDGDCDNCPANKDE